MPLPVLHVGYHKTATSWLQRCFFPALGDRIALFGRAALWRELIAPPSLDFDPERCRSHVAALLAKPPPGTVCVFSAERLSGNPHSGGYDAADLAGRLEAVFGEARVLIVVREQADMLVSIYKQYVKMGGTCTFTEYLSPPHDGRIPLFRLSNFRYHRLVEHYRGLFGETRVLVLPYELLQRSAGRFARRVLDHIGLEGVEPPPQAFERRINVSMSDLQTALRRRANLLAGGGSLHPVRPKAPRLAAGLFRLIDALAAADAARRRPGPLHARALRVAGDRYVSSNRRLQRYVSCDLAALGYRL